MKPITRFNQPKVLSEIGRYLLPEFFDRFKNELATMNVSIPDPGLADGPYYDTVAELFNSAALPPALLEAVLAVEELADPANKARLEQAFWESPYELYLEPQASPEHTALRLWLHAPFTSSGGADDSMPFSSPEVVCPVGEEATAAPRSSVPPEPFREPSVPPLPKSEPSKRPILSPPVKSPTGHTRKGKVARLPLAVRDRLNVMLQDGVPYAQAIKALGADAAELTVDHITSWKTEGGYQDWVNEQKDIEDMHLHEEYTLQLVKENGGTTLSHSAPRLLGRRQRLDRFQLRTCSGWPSTALNSASCGAEDIAASA
jgi:hypothetical protein